MLYNLIEQILIELPHSNCPVYDLGNVIFGGNRNDYLDKHGVSKVAFIERLAIQHRTPVLFTNHQGTHVGYHISLAQRHFMPGISNANDIINVLDYSKISPNSEPNYQNILVRTNLSYDNTNQFSFFLPGGMQDDTKGRSQAEKRVGGSHICRLEQLANTENFTIQSDGYVSAHHAGAVSIDTKPYWQNNLVRPEFIFCLNDRHNTQRYKHPRWEALQTSWNSPNLVQFNGNHSFDYFNGNAIQQNQISTAIFSTRNQRSMKFVLRDNAAVNDYLLSSGGAVLPVQGQWYSKNIVVDAF